jgi:hypothetical protein
MLPNPAHAPPCSTVSHRAEASIGSAMIAGLLDHLGIGHQLSFPSNLSKLWWYGIPELCKANW